MILKTGNMWTDSEADAILFTANSTVRADGALVMGRGAALEAQNMFVGLNKRLGEVISKAEQGFVRGAHSLLDDPSAYGIVLLPNKEAPPRFIGAFQVKRNFRDDAELELITLSTKMLADLAGNLMPGLLYALNFPGIGWGRLKREDVLPIISKLPDNVEVWEAR